MRPELRELLRRIQEEKIGQFRGITVLQDGKLWGELYHAPKVPYNVHSAAKSFMATAIGFAIDEGVLSLEDKVVDAFPDHLPEKVSDWLGGLTLRHLLMMSSGHVEPPPDENFMKFGHVDNADWLRHFLHEPIVCEPGTRFHYQSGDTYTAGVMLQQKVGMTMVEYLKSRLFDPLQIETPYWLISPEGYNIGFTGLWLKTEDLVKWAELYRNKGVWHGRRLLSEEWVAEATSNLIAVDPTKHVAEFEYGTKGYGYQIWMADNGAFYGAGLGGQYTLAVPSCNASIGFSAYDHPKCNTAFSLLWEIIVPALAK